MQTPKIGSTISLVLIAVVFVSGVLIIGVLVPMADKAHDMVVGAFGFGTKLLSDAWNYFFGTTRSSEAKTAIIAASAPPSAPTPPAPPPVVLPPEPATVAVSLDGTPFQ